MSQIVEINMDSTEVRKVAKHCHYAVKKLPIDLYLHCYPSHSLCPITCFHPFQLVHSAQVWLRKVCWSTIYEPAWCVFVVVEECWSEWVSCLVILNDVMFSCLFTSSGFPYLLCCSPLIFTNLTQNYFSFFSSCFCCLSCVTFSFFVFKWDSRAIWIIS